MRLSEPAADAEPRAPRIYLSKYRPLVLSERGMRAIRELGIKPYVDASCRREPDMDRAFPSISAIGYGAMFAPRLQPGDTVVYLTVKSRYENFPVDHWRVASVLKVIERFANHEEGAAWYRQKGLALPSNCLAEGNDPLPLDQTCGVYYDEAGKEQTIRSLDEWDAHYQRRVSEESVFLVCKPLFVNLTRPPRMNEQEAASIFQSVEIRARTAPVISQETLDNLMRVCNIRIAAEAAEEVAA